MPEKTFKRLKMGQNKHKRQEQPKIANRKERRRGSAPYCL